MKRRKPEDPDGVFDFPEDRFPEGEEYRIKNRLIDELIFFAKRFLEPEMERAMGIFMPWKGSGQEAAMAGVEDAVMAGFIHWFLFDHVVGGEDGKTAAEMFFLRRKLDLRGRQREVLDKLRQAALDLFEVRSVHPGRGLVLRRLADGKDFPVVEMSASRQVKRWELLVCRLWMLDGVHRLSPDAYPFGPDHRQALEQLPAELCWQAALKGGAAQVSRVGYAPCVCRIWLEAAARRRKTEFRNTDGERLVFCRARVRVADRAAVHRALLGQKRAVLEEEGPDTIAWLTETKPLGGERAVRGSFFWNGDELTFETNSKPRFRKGMAMLKRACGAEMELLEESLRPMEEALAGGPPPDPSPPSLSPEIPPEEIAARMVEWKQSYYRDWLNKPIPALGGKTPRQAVRSAGGRAQVAQLLKGIEGTEAAAAARGEGALDAGFLWEGLGLNPEDY